MAKILNYWKQLAAIAIPIIFLPIPLIYQNKEAKCAYTILIIILYWITEVVPLAVSSLIPLVLFPIFGIADTETLSKEYLKDAMMVFVGGMMVALSFEASNLHKRIALRVMLATGASLPRLMLGAMMTTMSLSMFMSNTSATAMMLPIIQAILRELQISIEEKIRKQTFETPQIVDDQNSSIEMTATHHVDVTDYETQHSNHLTWENSASSSHNFLNKEQLDWISNVRTMLTLSICYAANLGGTGTVTGTGTNLLALELLRNFDPQHHGEYASLTYGTWVAFCFVPMLINTLLSWLYLLLVFLLIPAKWKQLRNFQRNSATRPTRRDDIQPDPSVIRKLLTTSYAQLGDISQHETTVVYCSGVGLLLWVLHDPKFIPGWSQLFIGGSKNVSIATATILVGLLFLIIPRNLKEVFTTGETPKPLLEWEYFSKKTPWGIIIFFGGSLALSKGAKSSGLTMIIGQYLRSMSSWPPWSIQLVSMFVISLITELISNAATATIAIPILLDLSQELGIHPLYLTMPVAVACSYAFMLPVATTTNTLVYSTNYIKLRDMVRVGVIMNFSSVLVLFVSTNTIGNLLFNFTQYEYIP
ncbi:solute carrier family 13 member 5-like [Folsomia candida]|uniref:solute carrier family 13 member 5-like n=1 Tax=Folsomia candida TaxID=158441 RepID=UPI001604EFAF|nr:solute carrier family 13 member 5-like [Folsomia candida]